MKIYLVGGAVRDELLGLAIKERDWVVVGATPKEMRALGYTQVGKDFPVFLHPSTHEEYALARTERKTAPGYKGFQVHAAADVSLEEDLRRRDLTVNAIAKDEHGTLIDPFGGRADIDAGVLRHVSPAFAEDPVRILRAARFAARFGKWGFTIAHGTNALMRAMVASGEVDALVPERVWAETGKALKTDTPARFFDVLRGCGALARVFPELHNLYRDTRSRPHSQTVGDDSRAMAALRQAVDLNGDARIRFAALTHDLGHEGRQARDERMAPGVEPIEHLCARLRVPNDYRELAVLTARFQDQCQRVFDLNAETVMALLDSTDALRREARFEQFLLACQACAPEAEQSPPGHYPQAEFLRRARAACAAVDSRALAARGLAGADFGAALRQLRTAAIDGLRASN